MLTIFSLKNVDNFFDNKIRSQKTSVIPVLQRLSLFGVDLLQIFYTVIEKMHMKTSILRIFSQFSEKLKMILKIIGFHL
jgi:hypothetical protein